MTNENEDTKVDETFAEIIEKNKEAKERLAKERAQQNTKVWRSFRIKGKKS